MKNLTMYCLSLNPNHLDTIKKFNYVPVGLGKETFSKEWFRDNTGENISYKNKYYGEYTFHYWIWKNYLDKLDDGWIGFCQYRKFWSIKDHDIKNINIESLPSQVLKDVPKNYEEYDSILGVPIYTNNFKAMKFIKKGSRIIMKNPALILSKKKRNINFHFDLMHGENNLLNAINLLDDKNKDDFKKFVNKEVSFSPHNMFICKSKNKLKEYYDDLFPWLEKCEKLFGFENLKGFGKIRIYTFLAERFMPYWFKKNTKSTIMPIIFHDIRKDLS